MPAPVWLAAIEGFYGPPFSHEQRLDLIRWLPSAGLTDYAGWRGLARDIR